ncbi:hypothetical protein T484DRAFT_1831733 [Baffinella frigidus]|nr:hypothetical protein T484DRAFT_1831733 [Cryptophyta sp. CCMP2293]
MASGLEELAAKYEQAQHNAQKAMALFKATREENEDLRNNFERLKQAYQNLQGELRDSEAARGEVRKVCKERETQFAAWKAELDIKAKQFEEIKSQVIPPRELEEIRLRMAEELDYPSRQRCAMLEEELEKQREDFFQMRRQLEKMKFERDQASLPPKHHGQSLFEAAEKSRVAAAEHEQSMFEASEKSRAVEAELSLRINALQIALEDTTEVDEMSALQREVQSAKIREQQMRAEIAEVRAAKEEHRVARERAGQDTRDKVKELMAKVEEEGLMAEVEEVMAEVRAKDLSLGELRRKVAHLEKELAQEAEAHERTEGQLLSWERENGSLRAKLESRDAADKAASKKDVEEMKITMAASRELAEQESARRLQLAEQEAARRLQVSSY